MIVKIKVFSSTLVKKIAIFLAIVGLSLFFLLLIFSPDFFTRNKQPSSAQRETISPGKEEIISWLKQHNTLVLQAADLNPVLSIRDHTDKLGLRIDVSPKGEILLVAEDEEIMLIAPSDRPVSAYFHLNEISESITEIVDIAFNNETNNFYALDKLNNLITIDPEERKAAVEKHYQSIPPPTEALYSSISEYQGNLYLLDTMVNMIWKYEPQTSQLYKWPPMRNNSFSWNLREGDIDLSRSVDIAVNKYVYVLDRFGDILRLPHPQITEDPESRVFSFLPVWDSAPPAFCERKLYTHEGLKYLYLVDNASGRILLYDATFRETDLPVGQILLLEDKKIIWIQDIVIREKLYILTSDMIYSFPKESQFSEDYIVALVQDQPAAIYEKAAKALMQQPELDSPFLSRIKDLELEFPIHQKKLPEYFGAFPGSRRWYRYGVHKGMDLYDDSTEEIRINNNTPVLSAGNGTVNYISDYSPITLDEYEANIERCKKEKRTPPDVLESLYGNQIVILHKENPISIKTRYAHLSQLNGDLAIDSKVSGGDFIGTVGNSGSSYEIRKQEKGFHLHFEILKNDNYLGYGLSHFQTLILFHKLFSNNSNLLQRLRRTDVKRPIDQEDQSKINEHR